MATNARMDDDMANEGETAGFSAEDIELDAEKLRAQAEFYASRAVDLAAIREELGQLKASVAHLSEATAVYAQRRVQVAARSAVEKYPVASIMTAALVGYLLAGRRRY